MADFSSLTREETLQSLREESFDLLVIGGGITGAGIALDAKHRGLRTGLVEMQDFAAGTSSRSTKLVHGGLRYLAQFEVKLVAEVGKERKIVYENGPHVTTPEWMMLPFYKGGTFGPFTTNVGLRVYDFLAGVKRAERRKMLSPNEALRREPLLQKNELKGAGYYVEYKTDDARLTIEVLKKAVELGVVAANYTKVTDFLYEDGKIVGVMVEDTIRKEQFKIKANKVINATGPWVDELREKDGSKEGKTLHLTKGTHLVFSKKDFPLQQAIYFDSEDKRMIFAIPRGDKTYVGTTDTFYDGDIVHPTVTEEDRDYILKAIDYMFPSLEITKEQIDSSWAGLRPLIAEGGKNPSEISRKDEIFTSNSGLYSMAGGKLTGYRKMAEEVVDAITKEIASEQGIMFSKTSTMHLPISGGDLGGSKGFASFKEIKQKEGEALGIPSTDVETFIQLYGSNVEIVFHLYEEHQALADTENIDPVVFAMLQYALQYESVYKPTDFFIRRTGGLFFHYDWVQAHQDRVIDYMAKVLAWSKEQKENYTEELKTLLYEAKHFEEK